MLLASEVSKERVDKIHLLGHEKILLTSIIQARPIYKLYHKLIPADT